ncbi:MAG TPA: hypothetical protein VK763_14455 [Terriglobales bacterium]|jgi:hypothetical protein|nr:hypothetical protein [Terriglobales bacterium]
MTTTGKSRKKSGNEEPDKPVNKGRHESQCTICSHPQREEIEQAFVNWLSPSKIATQYSVSRDSVYRHAHALGLNHRRRRNVRVALERIIEKAGDVKVNAAAVVTAVSAYARINSRGEWVERTETINMNALFDRMTAEELETYAQTGGLPDWFTTTVGATTTDGKSGSDEQ